MKGGYSGEDPPLPIPNREVKLTCADDTATPSGKVGCRHLRALGQKARGFFYAQGLRWRCGRQNAGLELRGTPPNPRRSRFGPGPRSASACWRLVFTGAVPQAPRSALAIPQALAARAPLAPAGAF